ATLEVHHFSGFAMMDSAKVQHGYRMYRIDAGQVDTKTKTLAVHLVDTVVRPRRSGKVENSKLSPRRMTDQFEIQIHGWRASADTPQRHVVAFDGEEHAPRRPIALETVPVPIAVRQGNADHDQQSTYEE